MRVLAIDASLRNTGVAVIDGDGREPRALYFGTIQNASSLPSSSCLVAIRDRLAELIREHEPDCCALESVIYVQSHKTAILLGAARGAAILAAAERGSRFSNMRRRASNKPPSVAGVRGKIRSRSWCERCSG